MTGRLKKGIAHHLGLREDGCAWCLRLHTDFEKEKFLADNEVIGDILINDESLKGAYLELCVLAVGG